MLELNFYNHTRAKIFKEIFSGVLRKTNIVLIKNRTIQKSPKIIIELNIVGDSFIAKINKKYRNLARATDVISLSFFDKKEQNQFAGEIFISLPYARKQAKDTGHALKSKLRFLFVHGLLHIFGYDHKKPAESKLMQRLTDEILL